MKDRALREAIGRHTNFRLFPAVTFALLFGVFCRLILQIAFWQFALAGAGLLLVFYFLLFFRKSVFPFKLALIIVLCCLFGYVYTAAYLSARYTFPEVYGEVTLFGKIVDTNASPQGNYKRDARKDVDAKQAVLILDDVSVNGEKLGHKVELTLDIMATSATARGFQVGDWYTLSCQLYPCNSYSVYDNSRVTYGVGYTASAKSNLLYFTVDGDKDFIYKSKEKLQVFIYEMVGERAGSVAVALLMGVKDALADGDETMYISAGIMHVFVVSGLHVNLLLGVLIGFLRKLKIKEKIIFRFTIGFVVFYSLLCGFSPSIFRAGVMTLLALYATMRGKRYDTLSALALCAIALLLLNPLYVVSYSFALSFAAVTVIAFLYLPTMDLIGFLPLRLAKYMAICFCVPVGMYAVGYVLFGNVARLSVLTNFLFVPCITTIMGYLMVATALAVIFPPFKYLFIPYPLVTASVEYVIRQIAFLPNAYTAPWTGIFGVVALATMCLICNEYLVFRRKALKRSLTAVMAVLYVVMTLPL